MLIYLVIFLFQIPNHLVILSLWRRMVRDVLICHYNYFVMQSYKRIFVMVLAGHLHFMISWPATDDLLFFSGFFWGGVDGEGCCPQISFSHMCTYFDLYVEQYNWLNSWLKAMMLQLIFAFLSCRIKWRGGRRCSFQSGQLPLFLFLWCHLVFIFTITFLIK